MVILRIYVDAEMMIRLSNLFLCQLLLGSRGYNEDVQIWLYLENLVQIGKLFL